MAVLSGKSALVTGASRGIGAAIAKPKLVANFEFLEWTDSNHVRHIKFVGLRSDKDPLSVVRE